MSEERITILEEKLAYQEHAVAELSDALYRQQQRVDLLESLCAQMADRLRKLGERSEGSDEGSELPPHY
ncbi:SlyX protein [Natronocella acetinitrilica]|uniref:SlyX protein n=1 Tax=Natronocella acetinitrilica TaxID=414046 RepID=A0AAE3G4Z4_9GAMM|nr:SlyX family protein [Natronocella acetinitrilica]MCP1675955.1 SlyX protein [Natronocella acetinitrilica]